MMTQGAEPQGILGICSQSLATGRQGVCDIWVLSRPLVAARTFLWCCPSCASCPTIHGTPWVTQNSSGAPLEPFFRRLLLFCIICCLVPLPFSLSQGYINKFIPSFRCHFLFTACLTGMFQLLPVHHCCVRAAHKYSLFPLFELTSSSELALTVKKILTFSQAATMP